MKSILLSLTLAASLAFAGCTAHQRPVTESPAVAYAAENSNRASHLCGAMTKAGKPCTRRVSDAHGKDARCWQHQ